MSEPIFSVLSGKCSNGGTLTTGCIGCMGFSNPGTIDYAMGYPISEQDCIDWGYNWGTYCLGAPCTCEAIQQETGTCSPHDWTPV